LAYAPGVDAPLDVAAEMAGRGNLPGLSCFRHSGLRDSFSPDEVYQPIASG
jgi:hypothetical protein